MNHELRNVIAKAMFDAYEHSTSGADAQDILNAIDKAGYDIVKRRSADGCNTGTALGCDLSPGHGGLHYNDNAATAFR